MTSTRLYSLRKDLTGFANATLMRLKSAVKNRVAMGVATALRVRAIDYQCGTRWVQDFFSKLLKFIHLIFFSRSPFAQSFPTIISCS